MANNHITSRGADGQEALLNAPDFLEEIVRAKLQEILELEITEHIGAEPHERTKKREGTRTLPHGDVRTGGIHPQGGQDNRGALWWLIRQVHRLLAFP